MCICSNVTTSIGENGRDRLTFKPIPIFYVFVCVGSEGKYKRMCV